MTVSPQPVEIVQLVARTFREFGASACEVWEIDQTVLIDNGACQGRSYRADGLMAMWLIRAGIIQFYDSDGTMLRTINLFEELAPQRMAA